MFPFFHVGNVGYTGCVAFVSQQLRGAWSGKWICMIWRMQCCLDMTFSKHMITSYIVCYTQMYAWLLYILFGPLC